MRKLTNKQRAYVDSRARGLGKKESAIMAGAYVDKDNNVEIENSTTVQNELARIRSETAKNADITKEDVAGMLKKAADMAIQLADPQGLVAAARELGKLLGHYAPEIKKTLHGLDEVSVKKALELMSDEELFRLANSKVINGTATRVKDVPQLSDRKNTEEVLQEP